MELLLPGLTYHIYNHANGNEDIFREEKNYPYFLQKYKKHIAPVTDTYAYCLMPNHFHLLLKIKEENKLKTLPTVNLQGFKNLEGFVAKQFSNFFNSYSKSINITYNRRGSLFNPRFKRKLVEGYQQFQSVFLYIHLNPVKHGFVNHEEDWKWSSVHNYINRQKDELLNMDEAVSNFKSYENLSYCMNERRKTISLMDEE
jgi:REP element-mobilizing transposase RayT